MDSLLGSIDVYATLLYVWSFIVSSHESNTRHVILSIDIINSAVVEPRGVTPGILAIPSYTCMCLAIVPVFCHFLSLCP